MSFHRSRLFSFTCSILTLPNVTAPVELPLLTLADIETMIAGMDQGLTYNDRGQTPAPGDTIITREDLLRTPLNPAGNMNLPFGCLQRSTFLFLCFLQNDSFFDTFKLTTFGDRKTNVVYKKTVVKMRLNQLRSPRIKLFCRLSVMFRLPPSRPFILNTVI